MAATNEPPFEFSQDHDRLISGLASSMKLASMALLGLAAVRIGLGVVEIITVTWAGLWFIVEGMLTGFLGLVMWAGSTDTRFIVDTTGYDKPHLLNAFTSLTVFYKVQIGLALFVGAVVLLRLFI